MSVDITWCKAEGLDFTGRNGTFLCCGVEIKLCDNYLAYPVQKNSIVQISPITSKGAVGHCTLSIPVSQLERVITELNNISQACKR